MSGMGGVQTGAHPLGTKGIGFASWMPAGLPGFVGCGGGQTAGRGEGGWGAGSGRPSLEGQPAFPDTPQVLDLGFLISTAGTAAAGGGVAPGPDQEGAQSAQ